MFKFYSFQDSQPTSTSTKLNLPLSSYLNQPQPQPLSGEGGTSRDKALT